MANTTVNKVVLGNETLLDLTGDTVTPQTLYLGTTAHDASGAAIVGTMSGGTEAGTVTQDAQGYLVLDDDPGTHVTVDSLSVTQNGTYTASSGHAYSPVTVNVSGGSEDLKAIIERSATTPTLPSDLTDIGGYAFYQCISLELTSLPSSVIRIHDYAFFQCEKLALTSLPSSVTSIGSHAFYQCEKLALTSLPSDVTAIRSYSFYQCKELALTSLPSGVTVIESNAFYGCNKLALTSIPSGVTSVPNSAFSNTAITLTSLPSGIQTIGSYAFQGCSFSSMSCEGPITSLLNAAFRGCQNLETIEFPNMTVSSLGTAFGNTTASYACHKLESADIGSTNAIAANAFANCYALQTLVLRRSDAICTLANVSAFTNTPISGYNNLTGTVYVPQALISTYQTATNWSTLYDGGTVTFAAIEGSEYER